MIFQTNIDGRILYPTGFACVAPSLTAAGIKRAIKRARRARERNAIWGALLDALFDEVHPLGDGRFGGHCAACSEVCRTAARIARNWDHVMDPLEERAREIAARASDDCFCP